MKLSNEFAPIRAWAEAKGIYAKGDSKTQALKFVEEVGELSKAILNGNTAEVKDAIGDCVVVLTSIAELWRRENSILTSMNIESCINEVYKVIAKRKGSMKNGTFVKNK